MIHCWLWLWAGLNTPNTMTLETAVWANESAVETPVDPDTAPALRLQGFDEQGEIIDLHWPSRTDWVWEPDHAYGTFHPALRITIDLPPQVGLPLNPPAGATILPKGHVLLAQMRGPSASLELATVEGDGAAKKKIGMLVTAVGAFPQILTGEACGSRLKFRPVSRPSSFLFLAGSCKRARDGEFISLHVSDDARIGDLSGDYVPVASGESGMVLFVPDARLEASGKLGTVRIDPAGSGGFSAFEVTLQRDRASVSPQPVAAPARVVSMEASPSPAPAPVRRVRYYVDALGTQHTYTGGDSTTLDLDARAVYESGETELHLPAIGFPGHGIHVPADGIFFLAARTALPVAGEAAGVRWRTYVGLAAGHLVAGANDRVPGAIVGPDLTIEASRHPPSGVPRYDLRLGLSAFAGNHVDHAFRFASQFAYNATADSDLLLGVDCWSARSSAGVSTFAASLSIGVRRWL